MPVGSCLQVVSRSELHARRIQAAHDNVAAEQMIKSLVVYRISTRACHPADRARAGFDSPPGSLIFFSFSLTWGWSRGRGVTVSFVDTLRPISSCLVHSVMGEELSDT